MGLELGDVLGEYAEGGWIDGLVVRLCYCEMLDAVGRTVRGGWRLWVLSGSVTIISSISFCERAFDSPCGVMFERSWGM